MSNSTPPIAVSYSGRNFDLIAFSTVLHDMQTVGAAKQAREALKAMAAV